MAGDTDNKSDTSTTTETTGFVAGSDAGTDDDTNTGYIADTATESYQYDTGGGADTDTLDMDASIDANPDATADAGPDTDEADQLICDGGRYEKATGLCWTDPSHCCYTLRQAKSFCDELELAGHSDWMLPNRADFINLLGGCESNVLNGWQGYCAACAQSGTCAALFGPDEASVYWSETPRGYGYSGTWSASLGSGSIKAFSNDYEFDVRCVRKEE